VTSRITVTVKLYGVLRKHRPADAPGARHHSFEFDLQKGATIADLAADLGIDSGSISAVALNGEAAGEDRLLEDRDEVRLFPPSAGGMN
jgi:molybdopterin converting factor small subunit